jgi:hypothetical protein
MKVNGIKCEVMLLSWGETHNGGAKITLQLSSPEDLEPFKSMTLKKGKTTGQRMMAVLVEIGDDEQPVPADAPKAKTGPMCMLAVLWSRDKCFHAWLLENFEGVVMGAQAIGIVDDEQIAAWCIKKICGIESRKELDTSDFARARFDSEIRVPHAEWRKEHGLE